MANHSFKQERKLRMELTKIICPKCQHKNTNKTYKQIGNDFKEQVLNHSLFQFKCRQCGYQALLDYSLQYQDNDKKILIYYVTNQEELDEVMDLLEDESVISDTKDYLCRVVCSQEDLIEKITCFDLGLDDRILEIIKVLFYKQIQNEYPIDAIRFYEGYQLKFYHQEFEQAQVQFDENLYQSVKEQYPNLNQDIRIDFDWAVSQMIK